MHDFAVDLPADWLRRWAVRGRPVFRANRHRLFRAGDPADKFWLVNSGAVVLDLPVPGRGDIVIEQLRHGSVVGWSWLLAPYRWRFGAVVAEDMHAIEFDAAHVRAMIDDDPKIGRDLNGRFLAVLADRLGAARSRLAELYAYPDTDPGELR
ncbi:cyclic nucleotide-binding domain-containing protein [Actinoplanes oblitus]|uniref:Cyclic nucleotide-binding domain-containing protein n=1 Tax=Actinoplanes oblitus TaxID=3040509 RepID=A0ABY8W5E8_9ACTN|nr:cyclic nucleotide-binding domain-containing protein [Actinoplanes oblitus]WIM93040.1 cyclic nucleotide-binding domain-containing protein [Actinoplanes oblitus]